MVVTPSPRIRSTSPARRRAASSPPWPSGESARRSGASSRISPVSRSTAGSVPWTKKTTDAGSSPKYPVRAKLSRVAASFCGDVITNQGSAEP